MAGATGTAPADYADGRKRLGASLMFQWMGGQSAEQLKEWAVSGGKVPAPADVLDVAGTVYPGAFGMAMAVVGGLCFAAGIAAYVIMRVNLRTHPEPEKEVPHA